MDKEQKLQGNIMRTINVYSFHRNINSARFDAYNTFNIIEYLKTKYNVIWHEKDGNDNFRYINEGCDVIINHGSILIFEFDDTKEFKTFDFGDSPKLTIKLSKSKNFIGASIGQYNSKLWDSLITDSKLRKCIKPSIYPESYWDFGIQNYEQIQKYRENNSLDKRLCWIGSTYKNNISPDYQGVRKFITEIPTYLNDFYFLDNPLPFENYINTVLNFKLILGAGGGGGNMCGDFCFRDIEMFGIGIPVIRPKFIAETSDSLIPNYHYISVECEFDELFKYKNHTNLAKDIVDRYNEVIDDDDFLKEIAYNARNWYNNNISSLSITDKIMESLAL